MLVHKETVLPTKIHHFLRGQDVVCHVESWERECINCTREREAYLGFWMLKWWNPKDAIKLHNGHLIVPCLHTHSLPKPMSLLIHIGPTKDFFFSKINKWKRKNFLILTFSIKPHFFFIPEFIHLTIQKCVNLVLYIMFKLNIWKKFNMKEIFAQLKKRGWKCE